MCERAARLSLLGFGLRLAEFEDRDVDRDLLERGGDELDELDINGDGRGILVAIAVVLCACVSNDD